MSNADAKKALFHRDLSYDYPLIVRGEGIYLYDETGKRYIDGARRVRAMSPWGMAVSVSPM